MSERKPFELQLNSVTMKVYELDIPKFTAYRIVFSSPRPQLIVARARNADKKVFWTSIPEGRQKEAEALGNLIEDYLSKKENS
ncbi:MAG: hypothetical protein JNJ86_12380 [Chitinophagaceae bacterium]|nr:hypothetical protein [Chitinophagaceae bacterium]